MVFSLLTSEDVDKFFYFPRTFQHCHDFVTFLQGSSSLFLCALPVEPPRRGRRSAIIRLGHVLFRSRDVLFPLIFLVLVLMRLCVK